MTEPRRPLDGNALAGELSELIAADVTGATGQCTGCRATMAIAETRLYSAAPGFVARCPSCGHVLIRIVRSPDWVRIDLQGLRYLEFAAPRA
jgi:hypothetical protein